MWITHNIIMETNCEFDDWNRELTGKKKTCIVHSGDCYEKSIMDCDSADPDRRLCGWRFVSAGTDCPNKSAVRTNDSGCPE